MKHHTILYGQLLPTLGSRIVPALFRRLEAVAFGNDVILIEDVAKAIGRIIDGETGPSATAMLDHSSPFVKRAALKVLTLRPHAPALDRLWVIHREILADRSRFIRPHEHPAEASADSFAALRECVKLNPAWLPETISTATASDPIHVLASLVSTTEYENLWHKCKAELFAKVSSEHELPLVVNIFHYRDSQYVDWLRERIDRPAQLVGPWALRALARLAPDAAIAELPRLPIQLLSPTKRWCFSELQRRRPEPAKHYILELLRRPQPEIRAAMVYQRQEAAVDTETFTVLLELLERELDVEIAAARDNSSPDFYSLLNLISDMRYPHHLAEFRAKKNSSLATKLTDWLLRRGPIPGEFARPDQEFGLSILERIGGDGFTRVVNLCLASENPIARREASVLAFRRPDTETRELLKLISQRPDLDRGVPIEQSIATHALAVMGEYRLVIEAVIRWGLDIVCIDLSQQLTGEAFSDADVAPALEGVREVKVPPGVILALGIAGRREQTDAIRRILLENEPTSDTGYAALIALTALGDKANDTVTLMARHLAVAEHRNTAIMALRRIGTDAALEALLSHVESSYTDALALSLLSDKRIEGRTGPLLKGRLEQLDGPEKTELLARLVLSVQDPKVLATVLDEQLSQKLLYDAAIAPDQQMIVTGAKAASIRALAKFDADTAFDAAKMALQSPTARDRDFYPSLLVEIDPYAAISFLLLMAQTEKHAAIRRAIGRALAVLQPMQSDHLRKTLSDWLKDSDPRRRKAAIEVLSYVCAPGDLRIKIIRELLDDASQDVVQAASRALDWTMSVEATSELVKAVLQESNLFRKWVLLDALIGIADPGDRHRDPPDWFRKIRATLPLLWKKYLDTRVAERRKRLLAADKDD
ncbi:HEAT repeat domain-containing protein [Schlesneria sp. T3-172]|uniref:HEAT repeat domain-containing protein n=1 Tax=Schlesneria sphaerica TaxID=3373610 RepID=UPI0037C88A9B